MHTERGIPEELQDFIDFYLDHIEKVSLFCPVIQSWGKRSTWTIESTQPLEIITVCYLSRYRNVNPMTRPFLNPF